MDRGIDIGHQPIDTREVREFFQQRPDPLVWGNRNPAGRKSRQIVIEPLQGEGMKVGKVAGEIEVR
jgi:hypothetical protein